MESALKVINDSLEKGQHLATTLKNANKIVQKEWFRISSTEDSQPFDVEDYLDCFEECSPNILKYVVNLTDANVSYALSCVCVCVLFSLLFQFNFIIIILLLSIFFFTLGILIFYTGKYSDALCRITWKF